MKSVAGGQTAIREMAGRLAQFRALRARGALCAEATEQLANEAASSVVRHYHEHGELLRGAITLLVEIATLEEPCLSEPARRATFPVLVESLSDSFDSEDCFLYDKAFAQMICHCRQIPAAAGLDAALQRFGLQTEQDLLERKSRLRQPKFLSDSADQRKVRKVLILSRVTLGADVAISSVILEKARQTFPQAERVLLGSSKLLELFGGDRSLRMRQVRYATEGTLLDRLQSWLPLVAVVEEETRGLRPEEYLLLDPDSRLLQLGLLPVLQDESRYFFLETRRFGGAGQGPLSQITLRWLNESFGGADEILPSICLREQDTRVAQEICRTLRKNGSEYLEAVSFGVGGNERKRLGDSFEEDLIRSLLEAGVTILLDKGFGSEEIERANRLTERVRAGGWQVVELKPPAIRPEDRFPDQPDCRFIAWEGGIGLWSALIAGCDEYIGYDSAGQHIAAALGVPTVDIFTEAAAPIFRERWQPAGNGMVRIAAPPASSDSEQPGPVVAEVLALHQEIKAQKPALKK
ncbi:MAG: hypothetical protein HY648_06815 [Acidobacteria bacterium]|nr:hypothetical protein [Acidobacteriota bacterium]